MAGVTGRRGVYGDVRLTSGSVLMSMFFMSHLQISLYHSRGRPSDQVFYPVYLAKPAQPALSEQHEHCEKDSTIKNLATGYFVASLDAKDETKTAHVRTLHIRLLIGI